MKIKEKHNQGITLIALVVMIVVILILAGVTIYNGSEAISTARFDNFLTEMKIMQIEVNALYEKYTAGEKVEIEGQEKEVLEIGKDLPENTGYVFRDYTSGITDKTGYRYFDQETIKQLKIEGVEREFYINIPKRSIISTTGIDYQNRTYYTLAQIPRGVYNVEHDSYTGIPTFQVRTDEIGKNRWRMEVYDITYDGYINSWNIEYRLLGEEKWKETRENSFVVETAGRYEIRVKNNDIVSDIKIEKISKILPTSDETKPYLPEDTIVIENELDKGVVISDKNNNEWTWIEVPKSIFITASNNIDYFNIEQDMKTYAAIYRREPIYSDTWYDGCGLSETQYNNLKNQMLTKVYDNGGFWISRYEVGINEKTMRTYSSQPIEGMTAVSKPNKYVYNWVTASQAQTLASAMKPSDNQTASLLFGIQWDLTLKHLENKEDKTQGQLLNDSSEWGNYSNTRFEVTKGEYLLLNATLYAKITEPYTKPESAILFTTGVSERNKALNIYDLAGNVIEWSLERYSGNPSVSQGGHYQAYGTTSNVSTKFNNPTSITSSFNGFRATFL